MRFARIQNKEAIDLFDEIDKFIFGKDVETFLNEERPHLPPSFNVPQPMVALATPLVCGINDTHSIEDLASQQFRYAKAVEEQQRQEKASTEEAKKTSKKISKQLQPRPKVAVRWLEDKQEFEIALPDESIHHISDMEPTSLGTIPARFHQGILVSTSLKY